MKSRNTLLLFAVVVLIPAFAQTGVEIEWQRCYGGSSYEGEVTPVPGGVPIDISALTMRRVVGGGYVITGGSTSNDGDVSGNHGGEDFWVVKIDEFGEIIWQRCYGGSGDDVAYSVEPTSDGGFIVVGVTSSEDGDVSSGIRGGDDFWVVKLNSSGDIEWERCLGGTREDEAYSVKQTADGGFVVVGGVWSDDGDVVSGNHGGADFWVVKLSSAGEVEWEKTFGGSDNDIGYSVQITEEGGYVVAGITASDDGDVSSGNRGRYDYWVIKIDSVGNLEWERCLGGSDDDVACAVQITSDRGYVIAGFTNSTDGDISDFTHGGADFWLVKLGPSGMLEWDKCYGGSGDDVATSVCLSDDNGFVIAGATRSSDGDVEGYHGGDDFFVVKVDFLGSFVWAQCFGGSGDDEAYSIVQTSDTEFVVAGLSASNDGDVSGNHGLKDFWVAKIAQTSEYHPRGELCVNYLPVYLCADECFDLDICHDPTNPGYIYDSVYIWSRLEQIRTGSSGHISDLAGGEIPRLCNQSYFDAGRGEWVFGWDSVYIRADSNGIVAAETTIWVFNYPPDSGWIGSNGDTICPAAAGTLFAKYLEVRGALWWSFVQETALVENNFLHCEVIETTICIFPDHQAYGAPDSFELSPSYIDSAYDPCPNPICTTFVLLPTDVVPDDEVVLCPDSCETVLVQTGCYPYDHRWVWDNDSTDIIPGDTTSPDTLVFCDFPCGTTWVYYEVVDSMCPDAGIIDSFPVFVPCIDYDIVVYCVCDSGDSLCPGDSFRVCLEGALCEDINVDDICWEYYDQRACSLCATFTAVAPDTADTIFWGASSPGWVHLHFVDCWGCEYYDSVFIPVYPDADVELTADGGCAGDTVDFTLTNSGPAALDSFKVSFGDGTWYVHNSPVPPGTGVPFAHTYSNIGEFTVVYYAYTEHGCEQTDSIWVRQSIVSASLTASPNPVCRGGTLLLDASASTVEPIRSLTYTFIDSTGAVLDSGRNSYCEVSGAMPGVYKVTVSDGYCTDTASVYVDGRWVEVSGYQKCVVSGCQTQICINGVGHNCDEINYAYIDPVSRDTVFLDGNCFVVGPVETTERYVVLGMCADCEDSASMGVDTVEVVPVEIDASVRDTMLCYGDFIPNMLGSVDITPADTSADCDVMVKVEIDCEDCPDCDELVYDWGSLDALPDVFPVPLRGNCVINYIFAVAGDTSCTYVASAHLTVRHPVAVLKAEPDTVICTDDIPSLNACESYSNCTDINLCYWFFQIVDGTFIPLSPDRDSACCCPETIDSCCRYNFESPFPPGDYTFGVEVCMQDLPWCCDTDTITIHICEPVNPVVVFHGTCDENTVEEHDTIWGVVRNGDQFDRIEWVIPSDGVVAVGDSVALEVPSCGALSGPPYQWSIDVRAYRCPRATPGEYACETEFTKTFDVNCAPEGACGLISATEDLPLGTGTSPAIDLISHCSISDPNGDPFVCALIEGPDGLTVDESCNLSWTPDNCNVGERTALVEVRDQSVCAAATTLEVDITVDNTYAGIIGVDQSFGTSCVSSYSFNPTDWTASPPTPGNLTINAATGCDYVGLKLYADDQDECDCDFWKESGPFWLDIYPTGIIGADMYTVRRGSYNAVICHSDCHATDCINVIINVPNHSPEVASVPFEVWIPAGQESVLIRNGDFTDLDGDPVGLTDYSLTNSSNYNVVRTATQLSLTPDVAYRNFPGAPDTLVVDVSDGVGGTAEAVVLVWVYNPSEIQVEHSKPQRTAIVGAYPNPFNQSVALEIENNTPKPARVYIIDGAGRVVKNLFEGDMPVGVFRIIWNGEDNSQNPVPSGSYWCVFETSNGKQTLQVQLIR